jgi:PAS domain-containing protein/anti-sigma regulatory factor (Ser/Thr protein kinase)
MADGLSSLSAGRIFERLGLRQRVALAQSPLALVMLATAAVAGAFHPDLLRDPLFQVGLMLHAAIFTACFLLPWERWAAGTYLVIPLADFLAIGVSREGAMPILSGLGLLAIFPVIWLSASGMLPRAGVVASAGGSALIVFLPLLAHLPDVSSGQLASAFALPVAMLAVAVAIRFASANLLLQRKELESKDEELRRLLDESNQRERLLSAVLETVDVGVVALDTEGERILTNRQQHLFDELANPEGLPGTAENGLLIFSQDKETPLPLEKRPLRRAVAGETFSGYLLWLGEGADRRAVSSAARPVEDGCGKRIGSVVAFSDVTDLVEAISAKDEFVSDVSHEFRTPLTSILGYLELAVASGDAMPAQVKEYLDTARRNAERLLALVSDLLVAASTAMSIRPRPTDLGSLADACVGFVQSSAREAGVSVVNELPQPLWACADPMRIGQVLDNLLSNAIKYSPQGGVVTLRAHEKEDGVQLQVQDTGMGMTEDDAARVFSRFFRSSAAREASIPGVGLGLAITKTIVEGHGGTISCHSSPGAGTTFTVSLPAADSLSSSGPSRRGQP